MHDPRAFAGRSCAQSRRSGITQELIYLPRPRETRGPIARLGPRPVRRKAHPNNKWIERGLNGDASGAALSRAVAGASQGLSIASQRVLREMLHRLDALNSPMLQDSGIVFGLGQLARLRDLWIAPFGETELVNDFRRAPAAGQFAYLVRNTLCVYDVPRLFDQAWFSNNDLAEPGRRWFVHLGSGESPRTLPDLPYPLTRLATHHLLRAPQELSLSKALRWGQLVAIGAPEPLARAAAETAIADIKADAALVDSLGRFLCRYPDLAIERVGPMIDYAIARQRGGELLDPQPLFTFDGRTLEQIEQIVQGWHATLRYHGDWTDAAPKAWPACGINGWERSEEDEEAGEQRRWTIVELKTLGALMQESGAMHHCVATYSHHAASGRCAIFSLRCGEDEMAEPVLTIQVALPGQEIVQVRGLCNRRATTSEMWLVRCWADEAGLKLPAGSVL